MQANEVGMTFSWQWEIAGFGKPRPQRAGLFVSEWSAAQSFATRLRLWTLSLCVFLRVTRLGVAGS